MALPIAVGLHYRGWIVMSFISVVLFICVGVPAAYCPTTRIRTIYVAVVTPVMWLIYNVVGYLLLYRPMVHCTSVFRNGSCCSTKYADGNEDVFLITKEMYQLNNGLHALKCETAEMKAATTLIQQHLDGQNGEEGNRRDSSPFGGYSPNMP